MSGKLAGAPLPSVVCGCCDSKLYQQDGGVMDVARFCERCGGPSAMATQMRYCRPCLERLVARAEAQESVADAARMEQKARRGRYATPVAFGERPSQAVLQRTLADAQKATRAIDRALQALDEMSR